MDLHAEVFETHNTTIWVVPNGGLIPSRLQQYEGATSAPCASNGVGITIRCRLVVRLEYVACSVNSYSVEERCRHVVPPVGLIRMYEVQYLLAETWTRAF